MRMTMRATLLLPIAAALPAIAWGLLETLALLAARLRRRHKD